MTKDEQRQRESFFAMIRADQKNQELKNVFADWCEEVGDHDLAVNLRGGSEKWLREFAASYNYHKVYGRSNEEAYCELLEGCQQSHGNFVSLGLSLSAYDFDNDAGEAIVEKLWHHIHVVTGCDFDQSHKKNFRWSCSC